MLVERSRVAGGRQRRSTYGNNATALCDRKVLIQGNWGPVKSLPLLLGTLLASTGSWVVLAADRAYDGAERIRTGSMDQSGHQGLQRRPADRGWPPSVFTPRQPRCALCSRPYNAGGALNPPWPSATARGALPLRNEAPGRSLPYCNRRDQADRAGGRVLRTRSRSVILKH